VVSSLAYPNLLGTKRLGCCCCCMFISLLVAHKKILGFNFCFCNKEFVENNL
jgi:hypothetical protein